MYRKGGGMSANTFGTRFRVTTFGESHGAAVGCVIDGMPAGIRLDFDEILRELARRRPGTNEITSARKEDDEPEYLSGILDGVTLGTPIAIIFRNNDAKSADYSALEHVFRPGHADIAWQSKYGVRDARGGGRSSGRETVSRVIAGAFAKQLLRRSGITILAYPVRIAGIPVSHINLEECARNELSCPDCVVAEQMKSAILSAKRDGDSVGGIVECVVSGLSAGIGEPVFDKLDAMLAHAMLSIGAIKGIEFGSGFAAADMRGSENNDAILPNGEFASNNAGGILGGISNGDRIVFRCAVKPTPSIAVPQQSVDDLGNKVTLSVPGRHDPCIVPRILPVIEAMTAIVLADIASIDVMN